MNQRKSILLFILFLTLFSITGIIVGIYAITYSVNNHLNAIDLPAQSKTILGIVLLLVFDPLLFFIHRYAKLEQQKNLRIISLALLIFISMCVLSEIMPLL